MGGARNSGAPWNGRSGNSVLIIRSRTMQPQQTNVAINATSRNTARMLKLLRLIFSMPSGLTLISSPIPGGTSSEENELIDTDVPCSAVTAASRVWICNSIDVRNSKALIKYMISKFIDSRLFGFSIIIKDFYSYVSIMGTTQATIKGSDRKFMGRFHEN